MSWKDTLKMHCNSGEKMGCDCAKCREKTNKALSGKQKKLDRNKNGRIDGEDFAMLRNEKTRKAIKSDAQIEKEILAEIKKECGALGMKNLKAIAPPKELKRVLNAMKRKKVIFMHKDGDIYTHSPK